VEKEGNKGVDIEGGNQEKEGEPVTKYHRSESIVRKKQKKVGGKKIVANNKRVVCMRGIMCGIKGKGK